MDFRLSADQVALSGLVRTIVAGRFPLERIRRAEEARHVVDGDDWSALGEAGVFSLTIPEATGGAGLAMADAAVVFEELGRGLVPGPLVASHLAARLGVDGAADGSVVVGQAVVPADPLLIEHLDSLDAMVVLGARPTLIAAEDLAALAASATRIERSLDPLTPLSMVPSLPPGEPIDCPNWIRDARILTGALMVGMAGATCDLAVEYARGRQQFGRPIGSFQAVQHLCADMLVRTETARAAVQAAAVTVDQPDVGDADRAAAGSALLGAEAAARNAASCIQVYGGMGFTWEVPVHLYLMRARMLASSLGPLDALAEAVAGRL